MGKHIQDDEPLVEELGKHPCLYEKGNKGCKEIDRQKILWEQLSRF